MLTVSHATLSHDSPETNRLECRCKGAGEQDTSGMPVVSPECGGQGFTCRLQSWKLKLFGQIRPMTLQLCQREFNRNVRLTGTGILATSSAAELAEVEVHVQNLSVETSWQLPLG